MRHNRTYKKRLLFLTGLMWIGIVANILGQAYTINYKDGTPQTDIPERVDTVFINDGEPREMFIPELRNNDGFTDKRYRWYVRWYRADENYKEKSIEGIIIKSVDVDYSGGGVIEGGSVNIGVHKASLKPAGNSLFWLSDFHIDKHEEKIYPSTATGASTISYTSANIKEDIVVCDVSLNTDYNWDNNNKQTLTEPTLSKRYKFIIRPAKEIADRIEAAKDAGIENYDVTCPLDAKGNINIQMKTFPSNYCWYNSNKNIVVGDKFHYEYNSVSNDLNSGKKVIPLNGITKVTTLKVYAISSTPNEKSPLLATFVITPQEDSGFMLESDVNTTNSVYRNPDKHTDLYDFITAADFDNENAIVISDLKADNNICDRPMGKDISNYAFLNTKNNISNSKTPLQNQYGLYRSANVDIISKEGYSWFFTLRNNDKAPEVYDRTYARTDKAKCGYFYYIDASNEPGRLVMLEIDDPICQYTELLVTAWVNDMTTWNEEASGKPLPPNININFIGQNKDENPVVLHRFTSGDALTKYSGSHDGRTANVNVGHWQQICYTMTINNSNDYEKYYIEVQNNTVHTFGADYAIDDVRVYKSMPNIKVKRENECNASTLIVSSDYATLLRNMGWHQEPDVLKGIDLTNRQTRKYRYGLMGPDPYTDNPHGGVGNVYYGAVEKEKFDKISHTGSVSGPDDWVTLNKNIAAEEDVELRRLSKNIRIAVPTKKYIEDVARRFEQMPKDKETALGNEITMNIRAINDFISDTEEKKIINPEDGTSEQITFWGKDELEKAGINITELYNKLTEDLKVEIRKNDQTKITGEIIEIPDPTIEKIKIKGSRLNQIYEECLEEIYSFLKIPRIHCPWQEEINGQHIIYLGAIDVNNTDLKFKGEKSSTDAEAAKGDYEVVLFSARQIAGSIYGEDGELLGDAADAEIRFNDPCLLHSLFTVLPSVTITVDASSSAAEGIACKGSIANVTADLWVETVDVVGNETGDVKKFEEEISGGKYTFDWYLGDIMQYNQELSSNTLQALLKEFRDKQPDKTASFTKDDILNYYRNNGNTEATQCLERLLGDAENQPKLIIGNTNTNNVSFLWTNSIVAIPYIQDIDKVDKKYKFCTKPQGIPLESYDSPGLSVGFPDIAYPQITNVPLRLGLCNIKSQNINITIPIQKDNMLFGNGGDNLGMPYGNGNDNDIYLYDDQTQKYIQIATLKELSATQDKGGELSLSFKENDYPFKEGGIYSLRIPFGEYNGNDKIASSCTGYATLLLKIVPEYLTWKGDANAVWHNDGNWKQSTKAELYMGNKEDTDANGSDDIRNAFSPLYFTKITIPENAVLNLTEEEPTDDIKYDMAVNNTEANQTIEVVPYYGNKVNEIYFKPKAKLVNQHNLDYGKAWVELEIENNEKRWFASPLQDVYAGDFYAPKVNGRQETEAFKDINYDATNTNSRWAPAFYQKAWNSAINYATTPDGTSNNVQVEAVKSNWSIEYNDVTVKYPIGKGFYMSVEDVPNNNKALVRLPKADNVTDYQYEELTKASILRAGEYTKTNSGKLAELTENHYTLKLDGTLFGDNKHFLVGNPFMSYLDMAKFLEENKNILAAKYWRLKSGAVSANVVGTPDVEWTGESNVGTVEPMEAFFVELAENATVDENTDITFTPAMMSATEIAQGGTTTKGATATNPVITITAEGGEIKSVATLSTSDRADNGYRADEDAVVLLDSELDAPMVYTVAGSNAAQVNAVKSINNIGLGLYNDSRDEVTITINGLSRMANQLYLYDAHTGKSTKMESDSYSITVGGDSHGRYYLRDSELGSGLDNAISIYSAQKGRVIVSNTRPVKEIKVFNLSGSLIRDFLLNSTQYTLDLPAGIYMIYASDGEQDKREKVIVR